MYKKISFPIAITIIIVLAVLVSGLIFWQLLEISEEKGTVETILEDETADWKTYRNEEIGVEFKYPTVFKYSSENVNDKVFGAGVLSGNRITVTFKDNQEKDVVYFTAYTSDYEAFMEHPFTNDTDINSECSNVLSYNKEGDVCKIIEAGGKKAVFANEFEGYECSPFLTTKIFFSNKGDSIYKALEIKTLLTDVNEAITKDKDRYCVDTKQWEEVLSESLVQSKNIIERKNLSIKDKNVLEVINKMFSTFKFLD